MLPVPIPDDLLNQLARQAVRRIGAALWQVASRKLVAYLQHTPLLAEFAERQSPLGLLLTGGRLASALVASYQLEQVKASLAVLQMMAGPALGAAALGVGVSAVGFAIVAHRLGRIEKSLDQVMQQVVAIRVEVDAIRQQLKAAEPAETDSLLYQAEEAWVRSDADAVWRRLDGPLDRQQRFWRKLVDGRSGQSLFVNPACPLEQAAVAYESVLTLASARVQTLLLLNEFDAAIHFANDVQKWHDQTMCQLRPVDLTDTRVRGEADRLGCSEADARSQLVRTSQGLLAAVGELQCFITDLPRIIQLVKTRGVRGRDYLEAIRQRRDVPFLMIAPGS